jgi:hypothetical protein
VDRADEAATDDGRADIAEPAQTNDRLLGAW